MFDKNELNKEAAGQLKELYERITGNQLRRHSQSWEGACPKCGGDDRFWILDETPDHGYCRGCQRKYYFVDIVQGYYGLSYYEACNKAAELLGVTEGTYEYKPSQSVQSEKPVQMMETMPEIPSPEWQSAVTEAVRLAHTVLFQPEYKPQLDYLKGRGFTEETLHKYCIGYYPTVYSLPIEIDGKPVKASAGYYIPTFMRLTDDGKSNTLMRVKVRVKDSYYKYLLSKHEADPEHNRKPDKYISIKGSKGVSLFCSQYARPINAGSYPNIMFVEGEFDAMTINQCAGDICRAVTFGSHGSIGKAETWVKWYGELENTVICFDNDPDPSITEAVRNDETKLRQEIMKAQSLIPTEYRGNTPVIRHLPEQFHDWNDILQLPNGAQIIRKYLTDFFRR